MKKFTCILLLLVLLLSGCSGKNNGSGQKEENKSGVSYTIEGVTIVPGEDFAAAYEKLGEPLKYTEAASCYFDGMDKVFTYDGFEIRTYPAEGNKDLVQDLCISSDKYSTKEGMTVGSSLDDVIKAYGEDYSLIGKMYKYYKEDGAYTYFFISDDAVRYFGYATDASN
ncbi:MAG: hypothetical protein ACI4EW_00580 [Butyrivibrio sp.]